MDISLRCFIWDNYESLFGYVRMLILSIMIFHLIVGAMNLCVASKQVRDSIIRRFALEAGLEQGCVAVSWES